MKCKFYGETVSLLTKSGEIVAERGKYLAERKKNILLRNELHFHFFLGNITKD